ncbi:hypothetical protein AKO1_012015 [Acrasis kona]|uniref:Uncharacterized protein n=1 Tax=Acrasis kona TaxID=1008807 RepID=A0AAW2ZBA3_9EUKA
MSERWDGAVVIQPNVNDPLINNYHEPPVDTMEEEQNAPQTTKALIILYAITLVMVLTRSIDFVLYVRMSKKMVNYEWYPVVLRILLYILAGCLD